MTPSRTSTSFAILAILTFVPLISAQNPEVKERLEQVKAESAKNKQVLATYTWQEQDTISMKGEVKKQESFQVQMGPDGKPQKTPLPRQAPAQAAQEQGGGGRRGGRLKEKIVENKKEEFKEYAEQIGALAQSYAKPDPEKLQAAFQQGNVKMGEAAVPGQVALTITSYNKPNDSMIISIDKEAKAIASVQIGSYLDKPDDKVKIAIQFAKLPDGTNHISTMKIDGESKQLTVAIQNSDYKKM
jgi:hypothetical protein